MELKYLRQSGIGTYTDCPWKFFLTTILGFPTLAGRKAYLGTIVHHVLELMAKAKKTNHHLLKDKYSDQEYLLKISWDRYNKEKPDHFDLDDEDYKFCQIQVESVMNSIFNPLNLNVVDTEKQFQIGIEGEGFDEGFELRGTIDLITKPTEDTVEIIDYKTGQRKDWVTGNVKEWDDFLKDMQLKLYHFVSLHIYPECTNRLLTIIFTRDGGPFTVTFDDEDAKKTIALIKQHFLTIKKDDFPTRLKDDRRRGLEKFKCQYVCDFGKRRNYFIDKDNNIKHIDLHQKKYMPTSLTVKGVEYKYIDREEEDLCDRYYELWKRGGKEALEPLAKEEQNYHNVSRRNDYGESSKITKVKVRI